MTEAEGRDMENPAEPVLDVATAAEPGQPPDPGSDPNLDIREERAVAGEHDTGETTSPRDRDEVESPRITESETPRILRTIVPPKRYVDAFSQTFIKYAKNLSDKRFVQIVNTYVDHEDKSLVFYCTSRDLVRGIKKSLKTPRQE